ncbi:transcriptional regulator [Flavihumibacter stibioxidans]|uniref:HTH cro/C1-type domain-containing protein n=1 Tax=Flavihumibacter stibioxidans TaxID=1834163 RepID=A0ABR7M879_9BACT|nr:helix-turn-helix transcriptional regulator [Flavihumibacter stibioxidans]MBC6491039.1 hypothetical protein [Flavihumibacter stibioxidans]
MANKEKFITLVSKETTNSIGRMKARKDNRIFLRMSQLLALDILKRLDELNWTQKQLAERMAVSPQLVSKWVRGTENFTLETLMTLELALGITLIVRAESHANTQVSDVSPGV